MSDQQSIDKIFRAAAEGYSTPAPAGAWGRMDTALKAKLRTRRLIIWSMSAAIAVFTLGGISLFWLDSADNFDSNIALPQSENYNQTEKIAEQTPSLTEETQIAENTQLNHQPEEIKAADNSTINATSTSKAMNTAQAEKSASSFAAVNSTSSKKANPTKEENVSQKEHEIVVVKTEEPNKPKEIIAVKGPEATIVGSTSITKQNNTTIEPVQSETFNQDLTKTATLVSTANNQEKISLTQEPSTSQAAVLNNKDSISSLAPNLTNKASVTSEEIIADIVKPEVIPFKMSVFARIAAGTSLSGGIYNSPAITSATLAVSDKESSSWDPNIAAEVGVQITKNISVSMGFRMYDMVTKGDFVMPEKRVNYMNTGQFGYSAMGFFDAKNLSAVMRSKNFNTVDYLRAFTQTQVTVEYSEIPIKVAYTMNLRKWTIQPNLGFNTAFVLNNNVLIGDDEGFILTGTVQGLKQNLFGMSTGADINYNAGKHFTFGLKTDFVFYFTTINESAAFSYRPYSLLISPQIGFRF